MGVEIRFTKWGGARHWEFVLEPLGEDDHGWWLGGRTGMTLRRGLEAPLVQPHDFVTLVPAGEWWVASFNGTGSTEVDVYVDVTTAPVRSAAAVEAVDLDLDVVRLRDGSVRVLDEDEFADHQMRYRYPAEVVARAQASCDDVVRRITTGEEPFAHVAARYAAFVTHHNSKIAALGGWMGARQAVDRLGFPYRSCGHGAGRSVAEAARNQGLEVRDWPKLRASPLAARALRSPVIASIRLSPLRFFTTALPSTRSSRTSPEPLTVASPITDRQ